jgi:hypothetical protein
LVTQKVPDTVFASIYMRGVTTIYAQKFYSSYRQAGCAAEKLWENPPTEPSPNKRRVTFKISGEVSYGGEPQKCFSATQPACLSDQVFYSA